MILSIESSCDDSSIAITEIATKKLLFHKKISQESQHSVYGGVVPELASRLHAVALPEILIDAKPYFDKLKAIAVTHEPGLHVTLLEGITMAKTLSRTLAIPLIGVNHLKGHLYSLFIEKPTRFPLLALLVSGGHTMVLEVEDYDKMKIVATTLDDSVGESFDKCAKMMGLGYPGGPIIEELAREGDPKAYALPVPLQNSPLVAFSLSGLKNALRLQVESCGGAEALSHQQRCDLSASFQYAVLSHLKQKLKKVFKASAIKDFAIVGGVSANRYLKDGLENLCKEFDKTLHSVALEYCSDNAAMIGRFAIDLYNKKQFTDIDKLQTSPTKKRTAGEWL